MTLMFISAVVSFLGQALMDRALTGGVSAGTSLALGLQLLRGLEHHFETSRAGSSSLVDICLPVARWYDIHFFSLCLGIVIGLLLGPILEGLITVRVWIYQLVLRRAAQGLGASGIPELPLFRIH